MFLTDVETNVAVEAQKNGQTCIKPCSASHLQTRCFLHGIGVHFASAPCQTLSDGIFLRAVLRRPGSCCGAARRTLVQAKAKVAPANFVRIVNVVSVKHIIPVSDRDRNNHKQQPIRTPIIASNHAINSMLPRPFPLHCEMVACVIRMKRLPLTGIKCLYAPCC